MDGDDLMAVECIPKKYILLRIQHKSSCEDLSRSLMERERGWDRGMIAIDTCINEPDDLLAQITHFTGCHESIGSREHERESRGERKREKE